MSYIRKNYLTLNEEQEVWEVVSEGGKTVEFFGTYEQCFSVLHPVRRRRPPNPAAPQGGRPLTGGIVKE